MVWSMFGYASAEADLLNFKTEEGVVVLDNLTFNDALNSELMPLMVEFYAPWW
jgi:hypothetical protein